MKQPNYPLIVINDDKLLNVIPTEDHLSEVTVLGFNKATNQGVGFDTNGNKWNYRLTSSRIKGNFFEKLMAYILYNPIIIIKPLWVKRGIYQLEELKEVLYQCVDRNSHLTIQSADADNIKSAIRESSSFYALYKILNENAFKVKKNILWKS